MPARNVPPPTHGDDKAVSPNDRESKFARDDDDDDDATTTSANAAAGQFPR